MRRQEASLMALRIALALAVSFFLALPLHAQKPALRVSDGAVRIGLLLDMNSLYPDITGQGSVEAARMAIADLGGKVLGVPIELVLPAHQNKADLAALKTR